MQKDVCRICRREGKKLFLKGERCFGPKCSFTRRSYIPGQHGQSRRGRPSDYAIQLREKQKAKFTYGLRERQFKKSFDNAARSSLTINEKLLQLLELRLDNVVYRGGLAESRAQARQFINHGHIFVNSRRINIPSYRVREGEIISIQKLKAPKTEHERASWLSPVKGENGVKVSTLPQKIDLPSDIQTQLIVEFYSR